MLRIQDVYKKSIYFFIIFIIFIVAAIIIKYYFTPLFIIIFMTVTCKPLFDLLCKCKLFNKNVNAIFSILIINLVVFFSIFYTGKVLLDKVILLVSQNYLESINQVQNIIDSITNFFRVDFLNLHEEMRDFYSKLSYNNYIRKGALYTTQGIFAYFISNIAVYFILVDKVIIVRTIEKSISEKTLLSIKGKANEINNILKIELMLIIITTIETFFGLVALNINNAFFISLICGLLDLLPYIGTIMVFLPLILYNIIVGNKIIAFGLILLYILLQISRQIAETKFVSSKLKIHPLILVIGIYIGVTSFGVIGLFIVPLFIIVTKEIVFST